MASLPRFRFTAGLRHRESRSGTGLPWSGPHDNHTHTSLAMSALARTARIAAVLLLASKAGASEAPEPEPELALASERGLQGGRVGYNCASPTSCLL